MNDGRPPAGGARLGRRASLLVWLVAGLDVLLILVPAVPAIGVLAIAGNPEIVEALTGFAIYVLASLYGVVGAVIATRQPGNRIGWLLWLGGTALALSIAGSLLGESPSSVTSPIIDLLVTLSGSMLTVGLYLIVVFIPLHFPDGSLPSARWRYVRWFATAGLALSVAGSLPAAVAAASLDEVTSIVTLVTIGLALVAMVLRYRQGDRVRRQQIKWVAAVAGMSAVGFGSAYVWQDGPGWMVGLLGMALLPVAIGIAVLRHRLYEIDRIISRTVSYAVVTATLALVFMGAVLGLQAVLEPVTGGNTIAVAGSTLIVAALFQPLRRRVQWVVDRRFNRGRYDGQRMVDAFAERLRDEVDITAVTVDLDRTIHAALRPATLGLWVRRDPGVRP